MTASLLLLPATEALLEGWCGPVMVLYGDGHFPEMWGDIGPDFEGGPLLTLDGGSLLAHHQSPLREAVSLDLTRPEVQQHVCTWWLDVTGKSWVDLTDGSMHVSPVTMRLLVGRGTREDQGWLMRVVTEAS